MQLLERKLWFSGLRENSNDNTSRQIRIRGRQVKSRQGRNENAKHEHDRGHSWHGVRVRRRRRHLFSQANAQDQRIVIAASTMLDGKGGVLHEVRMVIRRHEVVAVETKSGSKVEPVDYDLRGLTVLPGWIDAHAHITWNLARTGKMRGWRELRRRMHINRRRRLGDADGGVSRRCKARGAPNDIPLARTPSRKEIGGAKDIDGR